MAQPVLDRARASAPATRTHPAARRPAAPAASGPWATPVAAAPAAAAPAASGPATSVAVAPAASGPWATPAAEPTIHVRTPAYGVQAVEQRPQSESAIAAAVRTADVIRLAFSVAVPSVGALSRVAALVEEALAASGRDRADVRVLLDLEVVLAGDERTARRKRSQLEHLDALAGLGWSPADSRVVTTADRLVAEVRELAARAGVDGVVLHPLPGGHAADEQLRALVA